MDRDPVQVVTRARPRDASVTRVADELTRAFREDELVPARGALREPLVDQLDRDLPLLVREEAGLLDEPAHARRIVVADRVAEFDAGGGVDLVLVHERALSG
jgi:hypothetical protein